MIALIDYGSGNLRSVYKALLAVGADVRIARGPAEAEGASAMVLPGVGAFDDCLQALAQQNLTTCVRDFIARDRPFLGICVGYQALFDRSEEFQSRAAGLGVFRGDVVRFPADAHLKVPQIGWNRLQFARPDCPLFRGLTSECYAYFVHSFFPRPGDPSIVASWTDYGGPFASSVWRGNLFATQFHPEKSQEVGLQILRNFADLAHHADGTVRATR